MNKRLPTTTTNWSQKFERRRKVYLTMALAMALLVALGSHKFFSKIKYDSEQIPVVVTTRKISAYQKISDTDIALKKIPRKQLPENALLKTEEAIDQITFLDIPANQIITPNFFKRTVNADSISAKISTGKTAMTIGFDWLTAPIPEIKEGDVIDIIASEAHKQRLKNSQQLVSQATFPVRGVKILHIQKSAKNNQDGYLVLEVNESQANNLMVAKALKVLFNVIIHQQ